MYRVPMYDFPREYELNRWQYVDAFDAVCRTGRFAGGMFSAAFEKDAADFIGVPFFSAVNSGTSALFLVLTALGVKAGDEVIVPSATFTATPGAVLMCGATPVFADCESDTWQISASHTEELIGKRTKAVLGVHLYGGMFDVEKIKKLTDEAGIAMVEDAAQAFGSAYKGGYAGSFGDAGCFSFYPTKNLGAFGEGGGAASRDKTLIDKINALKEHDMRGGKYESLGYNMRMDGIQGAILSAKLKQVPFFLDRKRKIAAEYLYALRDNMRLTAQFVPENITSSYHLFAVKADDRDKFRAYMESRGIETGVQYSVPCHKQKVFTARFGSPELPVTEELMERCVSVPVYPYLSDDEIEYVARALRDYR